MRFGKLAMIPVLAAGLLLCAAAPGDEPAATQPSVASAPAQDQTPGNIVRLRRAMRALAGRTRGVAPYTHEEWEQMMAFLQKYSPERAYVLAHLDVPENAPIRLDAIRKWRNYQFTKDHFPAVADALLKRFSLEDELFDLMLKAQADDSEIGEYRDLIHNKVSQLVKLDFAERQTRIDKLESMLNDEKQRLAHDQAMEDQIVDQRTDNIMNRLEKSIPGLTPTTQPTEHLQTQDVDEPQPGK